MSDHEADLPEKPPISIWKRLCVGAALFVLAMIGLGMGQHYWQESRNGNALQRVVANLDETDPGWRLEEIEAARATIPDDRNSARTVMTAHSLMPRRAFDDTFLHPFNDLSVAKLLEAERMGLLETKLGSLQSAILEARKLADMPEGRHNLVWSANPIMTVLDGQQFTHDVVTLLEYDALHLAQTGKGREALRSCRAALNAGRSIDDEPIIISQLMRIACVHVAAFSAQRVLALTEPPVDEMIALQKLVADEENHPSMAVGFRGERAILHIIFNGVANSSISLREMPMEEGPELAFRERWARWTLRSKARAEHPEMLKMLSEVIDVARLPMHEQAAAEKAIKDDLTKFPSGSLTRAFLPGLTSLGNSSRRKAASMRCLQVLLALEHYRRDRGGCPEKLAELTPGLMKVVPLDPFDGKPLRYKKVADGVIVYSVGQDGIDNGGNIERVTTGTTSGMDLGFQLWDVKHRRQPPKAK
jgi:hypothetical protein